MPNADDKLLPCPFCGSFAVMFEDYRYRNHPEDMWTVYGVQCSNSDCIMHQTQKFYANETIARMSWNKRACKEGTK